MRRSHRSISTAELPYDVKEQVDINIKYDGYIKRQMRQVEQFKNLRKENIRKY